MITAEDALISLIDKKSKKIKATNTLINKVDSLEGFYIKEVRNWLVSNKNSKFSKSELNYEDTKEFIEGLKPNDELFSEFVQSAELSLDYQNKVEYLKSVMPVNLSTTLFGVDERLPSTFEQKKWLLLVEIFNNPKSIIDKLNAGILMPSEVDSLAILYPSILETIKMALIEGISELKAKGIDSLGTKKMNLINMLLQIPRLSPDKLIELQKTYQPKENGETDVKIEDVGQTDVQRIANK